MRSISNPPADVCLGGGFEIDVSAAGNFQPPLVRPIPDSPPCKYVCYNIYLIIGDKWDCGA